MVTSEISELLSSGRIREVSRNDVHTINPLSVADNGDKLRLILDLRHINQFLRVPKIKFEDIRTIGDLFQLGNYFSNLILSLVIIILISCLSTRST